MPLPLFQKTSSSIKKIIAVAAGKGGVGKSFVTIALARALKLKGFKVGILDADLCGPSVQKMMPEDKPPYKEADQLQPAISEGILTLSMAHFRKEHESIVIRAPIANQLIEQFIRKTDWGRLDVLIIDFPPGTSDIALSVAQLAPLDGALLVTTPQEVSLLDVRRAAKMFIDTGVNIIGIVENMSFFQDPISSVKHRLFSEGGGAILSNELGVPLIAEIPLVPQAGRLSDLGFSLFLSEEAELINLQNIFCQIADRVMNFEVKKSIRSMAPLNDESFKIEWSDGLTQQFDLAKLQNNCPCAGCLNQTNSEKNSVRAKGVMEAGRYALKIDFESGCKNGIYTYDYLRKLGSTL